MSALQEGAQVLVARIAIAGRNLSVLPGERMPRAFRSERLDGRCGRHG